MQLNTGINGININLFNIAHSLIIQINVYLQMLKLDKVNVSVAIITQMTSDHTN